MEKKKSFLTMIMDSFKLADKKNQEKNTTCAAKQHKNNGKKDSDNNFKCC